VSASNQQQTHLAGKNRKYRIVAVLAVILLLNLTGVWIGHLVNFQLFPRHDTMLNSVVLVTMAIYILLMATPFMPGIEVGLAVMWMLGAKSALLIYLCTLLALSIIYWVGKLFPVRRIHQFLQWLYLHRASELLMQLEPLNQQQRLDLLLTKAPHRIAPLLLKNRYLAIALILNLPGNALIGGGGGIGLVVGVSQVIPFHKYFLTVALSVLPLPLYLYLQGV
jgi:hypothetical protein